MTGLRSTADLRVQAREAEARIRSTKLAALVASNPEAVLVLEREIDDWTLTHPPDEGEPCKRSVNGLWSFTLCSVNGARR